MVVTRVTHAQGSRSHQHHPDLEARGSGDRVNLTQSREGGGGVTNPTPYLIAEENEDQKR